MSSDSPPGSPTEGIGAGDAVGAAAAQRPRVRGELLRDHRASGAVVVPVDPAQAGRARVLLPQCACARDQRRPQRRRLRAHRGRLGRARQGDHHQRRPRPGADDRHADGGEPAERLDPRSPEEAFVYQFSSGLDRPAQARGPHARAAARPRPTYYDALGIGPRGQDVLHDPAVPHLRHGLLHARGDAAPARRSCCSRTPTRSCSAASARWS